MNKIKRLEYYFDSKKYTEDDIQANIEEVKKEFPKQKVKVETTLNNYGMYIITFYFENRNTIFNKISIYIKNKRKPTLLLGEGKEISKNKNNIKSKNRLEKYSGKQYGSYKTTNTYKPY